MYNQAGINIRGALLDLLPVLRALPTLPISPEDHVMLEEYKRIFVFCSEKSLDGLKLVT